MIKRTAILKSGPWNLNTLIPNHLCTHHPYQKLDY